MQCKCHTWCLWSDQQPAHQHHTLILITCLLLWPLPAVTQKLPHIWSKTQNRKKEVWWKGWERLRQKAELECHNGPFIDWATSFIALCARFCVHPSHQETNEEETQISRWVIWDNVDTVHCWKRWNHRTKMDPRGWGRIQPSALSPVWKKYGSWNNVLTMKLFIRLFIDVCWHWSATTTAEPLLSILFDFISQSPSQERQLHAVPAWSKARVSVATYPLTWYSAFSFFFPSVHPLDNKIYSSCCLETDN